MPRFCAPLFTLLIAVSLAACDEIPDLSLPNVAPQAFDDEVDILQDVVRDINITGNDIDVDGNVNEIAVTSDPEHGSAEVLGNIIRYTPDRLFAGVDTFTYRITDTKGESDEATVTVTVKLRQTRALFEGVNGGVRRLYMLDSRQADSFTDLSATLEATESVRDWAYDSAQQEAVILTDADRIVTIPLSDPAAAEGFPIELQAGETVDDGFDISSFGRLAAFSVNNRFVRTFDLDAATFVSIDTGWTDSTMEILFSSPLGTGVVMTGTLGDPAVTALYFVNYDGATPVQLFEGDDATGAISARTLPGQTSISDMVWLLEQPGVSGAGPFSCLQPPMQRLSALFYTSLLSADVTTDLNAASGLLPDDTDIIFYDPSRGGRRAFVAACPPGVDIVQLIEIPMTDAATARVIATGNDTSDGFYGLDVASDGLRLIYVIDGDNGLRPVLLDPSDPAIDPVATDLTSAVPQFQTFPYGMETRAPASVLSSDNRRWVFLAPDNGEPRLLTWLELDEQTVGWTTLPFASIEAPLSDGYHAFVRATSPDPGNTGVDAQVALVRLDGTAASLVTLPGAVQTRSEGALGVAPVVLAPVALADSP